MKNIKTLTFSIGTGIDEGLLQKDFEITYDNDDKVVYESKKTFKHEEGEGKLNFEYKYLIEVLDIRMCEDLFQVCMSLVVNPKDLSPKKKTEVRNSMCPNPEELLTYTDVLDYGLGVDIAYESLKANESDDMESCGAKELANDYANIIDAIEGLFGFFMDSPRNRIGQTGWDLLKEYLM